MADVSAEILEAIEKNFEKFYQDPVVKRIYGKIYEGTATYTDSHTLASLVARYKREAIEKAYLEAEKTGELTEDVYGQIVKGTLDPELRDGRELVAEACGYVQKDLNHKSGIGLGVVDPGLNESRVDGLVKYVTEANEPKLSSTVVPGLLDTFHRSAVDEYLEANLDFQRDSGLAPQISRTRGANSNPKCAFCAGLVYTGDYKGDGMPDEIFSRHRYCHCNLLYSPMGGSGRVQDSWSKKEYASYQEAEKAQREYLTNLDKMTKDERWEVRKQKDREQKRARRLQKKAKQVNPSELRAMEYIDGWYARDGAVSGMLPLNERRGYDGLVAGTPATGMTAQKRAAYAARKTRETVANDGTHGIIKGEKGLDDQSSNSINRSIRKIERSKKEHEDKIRNPEKYIEDWGQRDERYREGIIRYWKKEIAEKDRAIKRRKEKLRERGDLYE